MGLSAVALNGAPGMRPLSPQDVNAGLAAPCTAAALLGQSGTAAILILVFLAVTSATSAELIAVSSILTCGVYKERPQWTPLVILMTPTFCAIEIYTPLPLLICTLFLCIAVIAIIQQGEHIYLSHFQRFPTPQFPNSPTCSDINLRLRTLCTYHLHFFACIFLSESLKY